jgi:uncharacterized protein with HEPN domain
VRDDGVYLRHILDAINRIEGYVAVGWERFLAEPHWQDATIRQLEIIGEAGKQVSAELKAANPQVPWRRIAGLRDVLIHQYFGVDLAVVWGVAQRDLPPLKANVAAILNSL